MKWINKKFFLIWGLVVFLFLTAKSVFGATGGFYILDGSPLSKDYVSGGTVIIDWRDLEPNEGEFHWELFSNQGTYIPWLERFYARLEGRTPAPKPMPGTAFYSAYSSGKKVRFKLRVTEGAIPLWLYGGTDDSGKRSTSYGGICAYENYDEVGAGDPKCNPQNDIVIAITYPLYPTKEDNAEPVWWNPIFQQKMKNALMAIDRKIKSDPVFSTTIEFVEASVGSYGEMILYGKSDTFQTDSPVQRLFRSAGYTNAVYSQAVLDILANYQEAFPEYPIALSLGNGLYAGSYDDGSGVTAVEEEVVSKAMPRWGSKLYLKFAGFGGGGNRRTATFGKYCPAQTRCIYESYGGICSWSIAGRDFPFYNIGTESVDLGIKNLTNMFKAAVTDQAYIVMMWSSDWKAINDARRYCGGSLSTITDDQNAEIKRLEDAFSAVYPNLVALGNIEPSPAPFHLTPMTTTPTVSSTVTPTINSTITPTSSVSDCPNGNLGNLDCDSKGLINDIDLQLFLKVWTPFGFNSTPSPDQIKADLNTDHKIDESDLTILLSNWKTN